MRRIISIILTVLLCLSMLSGCGNTEQSHVLQTQKDSAENSSLSAGSTVFRSDYYELQDQTLTSLLENGTVIGDSIYFTSLGITNDLTPEGITPDWPEQYWTYGPVFCKVGLDGSVDRIPYSPSFPEPGPGETFSSVFEKACASQDGSVWLLENRYHTWREKNEENDETDIGSGDDLYSEESYFLTCIAEDGAVVSEFSLSGLSNHAGELSATNGSYSFLINDMAQITDGRIILAVSEWYVGQSSYAEDDRICILNHETGELLSSISLDSEPICMAVLDNGKIAVSGYEGASPIISVVDLQSQSIVRTIPVIDNVTCLEVEQNGDELYFGTIEGLYHLNTETGESDAILNWVDCDVSRDGNESVCFLPDGRIVTTYGKQTAGGVKNELIVLTPTEASQVSEKTVLRLAVMNLYPFTSEMVSSFNRNNPDYRIEVTDYSQYNDYSSDNEEDWNAGINRLQTEIIAGNVPDILDISLLSADRLGAKGILVDLYSYIDADPEFGRTDLNEHVLSAFEENGKLYQTVSNYYVLTTAALSAVAGDKMGWTMYEFRDVLSQFQQDHPDCTVFDCFTTRDDAMTFLLYLEMENFVDWEKGECRFDSDAFVQLLNYLKEFPESFDWGAENPSAEDLDSDLRMLAGKQLMKQCNFTCFEDVQTNTAGLKGIPCTFIGYPTESGVGSMFAQIGNSFAITSGCMDKNAAWQFVRQFFLPGYQEQFSGSVFPTNNSVYQRMKEEALTTQYQRNPDGSFVVDSNGMRVEADRGSSEIGGKTYHYRSATSEEIELVEQIIASTTHVLRLDQSLEEIIVNGTAPYFADQKTDEEVAKLIQSKALIYVNEQR